MANTSIYNAFERMWAHVVDKVSTKAEKTYVDSQNTTTLNEAKGYTDEKVGLLMNNSSEAVDSVMELAAAMENNKDAIDALTEIAGKKVDKVDGKGLSTNDYTTEEKNKLAGIAAGAEVNVQSDWNQNDETAKDYIKNKPFGEIVTGGDTITWDGNTEGLDCANSDVNWDMCKISDAIITLDDLQNGCQYFMNIPEYPEDGGLIPLEPYDIVDFGTAFVSGNFYIAFVSEPNTVVNDWTFPSAGIYVHWSSGGYISSLTINGYTGFGEIEIQTLDEKFIPDTIARIDDLSTKLDVRNPNGTGSFSLNRKANSEIGSRSFAVGNSSIASGMASHAEGVYTEATGTASHAEGDHTIASGNNSHAEGMSTKATGMNSHAEGMYTEANNAYSHAEGDHTMASGDSSHTEGAYTIASSKCQHVQGKYNVEDASNTYAHIVGNGAGTGDRSNAHTLDWDGNAWFAGDVYVGSTSGTNKDDGSKKLATEEFVNQSLQNFTSGTQVQILTWETND